MKFVALMLVCMLVMTCVPAMADTFSVYNPAITFAGETVLQLTGLNLQVQTCENGVVITLKGNDAEAMRAWLVNVGSDMLFGIDGVDQAIQLPMSEIDVDLTGMMQSVDTQALMSLVSIMSSFDIGSMRTQDRSYTDSYDDTYVGFDFQVPAETSAQLISALAAVADSIPAFVEGFQMGTNGQLNSLTEALAAVDFELDMYGFYGEGEADDILILDLDAYVQGMYVGALEFKSYQTDGKLDCGVFLFDSENNNLGVLYCYNVEDADGMFCQIGMNAFDDGETQTLFDFRLQADSEEMGAVQFAMDMEDAQLNIYADYDLTNGAMVDGSVAAVADGEEAVIDFGLHLTNQAGGGFVGDFEIEAEVDGQQAGLVFQLSSVPGNVDMPTLSAGSVVPMERLDMNAYQNQLMQVIYNALGVLQQNVPALAGIASLLGGM